MGLPITTNQSLMALKMYCKGQNFNDIKKQLGKYDAQKLVRYGITFLVRKYNIEIQKDEESILRYTLTENDKMTLFDMADNELEAHTDNEILELPPTERESIIEIIEDIKKERIEFMKKADVLFDKIKKLERKLIK